MKNTELEHRLDQDADGAESSDGAAAPASNRVLLVDDEEALLSLFKRLLTRHVPEWHVSLANSVDAAWSQIQGGSFDVIVSDIRMPGKTGFDLLALVRGERRTADLPMIFLTGHAENDSKRRALDMDATDLLTKPVEAEDLIARIRSALRLKSTQDQLKNQNQILEQRVRERTIELELSRLDIVRRLAIAGEFRDNETGEHVARVAWTARIIGETMGLPADTVELLFITAPLHDIGKIGIPDAILRKPGPLTPEERVIIEQHCEIGAKILAEDPQAVGLNREFLLRTAPPPNVVNENRMLRMACSIAFGHHEKWDGTGYPLGLKGEEIPLECRIVAVVDVFDALCSERPYKPMYSWRQAHSMLRKEVGTHFDPLVFEAFDRGFGRIMEVMNTMKSLDRN